AVAGPTAALVFGIFAAVYLVLNIARLYQTEKLRPLAADWLGRNRIPVQYEVEAQPNGGALLRVRSPLPTSTGTVRQPGDAVTTRPEMAVLAVEIDGAACAGRVIKVAAIGESNVKLDTTFSIWEDFWLRPESRNYMAFLPAFFWRLGGTNMAFSGIWTQADDVKCIRSLATVSEFKKDDVLFDFLLPTDPARLNNSDFFRRVRIPGLGNL